ncbi:energy transducer TonB [Paraburkholderia denitrificans]|uniref:Energy transducer TonB n=1 Tax=Paraburkholderia denitrificans TaxID=694025 RepID=A0ABW0JAJ1_9BURK
MSTHRLMYARRDSVAAGLTVILALLFQAGLPSWTPKPPEAGQKAEERIELSLVELPEPKPTPIQSTPEVTRPPEPVKQPPPKPQLQKPQTQKQTQKPIRTPTPAPEPTATEASTLEPVTAPAAPSIDAAQQEMAQAQPSVAAREAPKNPHADQDYEKRVRALIESRKRYPTSRQASIEKPAGTVGACLTLGRDGAVKESSIATSSGSVLLDSAAKRLIEGVSYPPFDEAHFKGQPSRVFCMSIDYQLPSS